MRTDIYIIIPSWTPYFLDSKQQLCHILKSFAATKAGNAGPTGRAVCCSSPAEMVGLNPTVGMDVCLLSVLCDVR